ncbi:metallophosphoesterase [Acinetobacter apis]|uniref:Calcineurin-like phosphoesterase domain-containing protein n=1 Tax=Acinetobacter apis TaxID=1229165 RepID=A0A217EI40_9GAMM|nr:metallophosphoesterase [Acinetobacter apis]SNQ30161.1 hypothetical protein SAMN05444584_2148 [Acinetobacter apis]
MWNSNTFFFTFYIIFIAVAIWAAIQSWRVQAKTETIHPVKAFIHLTMRYQPYLLFPLFAMALLGGIYGFISVWVSVILIVLSGVLIYARFIEPHCLQVKLTQYTLPLSDDHQTRAPFKIALIADLHVGLFSGSAKQLKKIVDQLNEAKPDIVVVAGDWTYEPEHTLADQLSILKDIQAPVYSVNGNHDEEFPGPPIQALLKTALERNHIVDIEGQMIEFDHFRMLGVGDLWAGKSDMSFMPNLPQDKPWVIVSHNPDTIDLVPQLPTRPLMLSGHTHGGQVELPWFTDHMMRKISILGHKRGLYVHENADVYVTVGTGMVGIPFRFRVKPTIDLIELR